MTRKWNFLNTNLIFWGTHSEIFQHLDRSLVHPVNEVFLHYVLYKELRAGVFYLAQWRRRETSMLLFSDNLIVDFIKSVCTLIFIHDLDSPASDPDRLLATSLFCPTRWRFWEHLHALWYLIWKFYLWMIFVVPW